MTTIRINLLPHREEKRAQQQRTLVTLIIAAALVGLAVVVIGHMTISSMTSHQNQRNNFLKQQLAKLDKQIKEIAQLKQKTDALLDRKKIVETLQSNRTETVHLFDELAQRLPKKRQEKRHQIDVDRLRTIERRGTRTKARYPGPQMSDSAPIDRGNRLDKKQATGQLLHS